MIGGSCHEASFFLYRSAWGLQLKLKLCGYLYVRQDYLRSLRLRQYRHDSINPVAADTPIPCLAAIIEKSLLYATRHITTAIYQLRGFFK